jgi:hypothetical protein
MKTGMSERFLLGLLLAAITCWTSCSFAGVRRLSDVEAAKIHAGYCSNNMTCYDSNSPCMPAHSSQINSPPCALVGGTSNQYKYDCSSPSSLCGTSSNDTPGPDNMVCTGTAGPGCSSIPGQACVILTQYHCVSEHEYSYLGGFSYNECFCTKDTAATPYGTQSLCSNDN